MVQQPEKDNEFFVANQNSSSSDAEEGVYISPPSGTYSDGFNVPRTTTNESVDMPKSQDEIIEITDIAKGYLEKGENTGQARQLNDLLDILTKALSGYDIDLPKLRISLADDNSISLVWRIGTAYFGVSIFADENDSSWSLIESGTRGFASDGYLNDAKVNERIQDAVNFLVSHKIQGG
jgi:hypothetical protein